MAAPTRDARRIAVREARLPDELGALREVHNANRQRQAAVDRFEWAYLRNPVGRATAWLAIDEATGRAVGCGAVHPRRVAVEGEVVLGWTTGDLSVHEEWRGLGIGLALRRATREAIDAGRAALLYSHPNPQAASVHRRAGHLPLGSFVRRVKLLCVPAGPRWMRAASSLPLRLAGHDPPVPPGATIDVVARGGGFDAEFDRLFASLAPSLGVAVERSGSYLAWRFHECPHEDIAVLALRHHGLRGWLAYVMRDGYVAVKDWLADSSEHVGALFGEVARRARAGGLGWVSVTVLDRHPHLAVLRSLGYFARGEHTLAVAYAPERSPLRPAVADPSRWYMTVGDRDV